jgi:hypothetical protein
MRLAEYALGVVLIAAGARLMAWPRRSSRGRRADVARADLWRNATSGVVLVMLGLLWLVGSHGRIWQLGMAVAIVIVTIAFPYRDIGQLLATAGRRPARWLRARHRA